MVQQITKGIKISVKTVYNGITYKARRKYHSFSYFISIENNSTRTVQLLERFWIIFDSLNDTEFVEGEGVVGQTPILPPNSEYNYKSNCFLNSSIGAMKGNYKVMDTNMGDEFLVTIPVFQLNTKSFLN